MVKKSTLFDVINITLLIMFSISVLYPFIYMIAVSLSSNEYVMRGEVTIWPKGFTTHVYESIFKSSSMAGGYKNTIIYVVLGTIISLVLTAMAAYSLARKHLF